MTVLQPLASSGSAKADEALKRMTARIGYRPNALATISRRPDALIAVLSLAEAAIFDDGASSVSFRWLTAYATSVGAGCIYSSVHAAHGAVEAGENLSRVVAAAYDPEHENFNSSEQLLLKMAIAIGRSGDGKPWTIAAREQVGEAVLAEMVLVCAMFGLFNRWNRTIQTVLEPELQEFATKLAVEANRQEDLQR